MSFRKRRTWRWGVGRRKSREVHRKKDRDYADMVVVFLTLAQLEKKMNDSQTQSDVNEYT